MDNSEMTDEEKDLANFCAEYANNGNDAFEEGINFMVYNILKEPSVDNLKVCMRSYAALVLMYAIETGKANAEEEELTREFFKKVGH